MKEQLNGSYFPLSHDSCSPLDWFRSCFNWRRWWSGSLLSAELQSASGSVHYSVNRPMRIKLTLVSQVFSSNQKSVREPPVGSKRSHFSAESGFIGLLVALPLFSWIPYVWGVSRAVGIIQPWEAAALRMDALCQWRLFVVFDLLFSQNLL